MISTEPLKLCPYRDSSLGYLLCKVSPGGMSVPHNGVVVNTSFTTEEICRACPLPDILQKVNCKNIIVGKRHTTIFLTSLDYLQHEDLGWRTDCSVYGFSQVEDYKKKCSENCPSFRPIHRDIDQEECIPTDDNFDTSRATDRALRQAVLAILYKYHSRHPERFNCFDVTPEFIGKCLSISVQDVVRVVSPMEEEGEVETKRFALDLHFRYVTIRSKGIRMIDNEPLFERLDTAQIRVNDLRRANIGNWAENVYDGTQQTTQIHPNPSQSPETP